MTKTLSTLLILSFLTLSFISQAQTKTNSLEGIITDQKKNPLESVSVSLLQAKDSSIIKTLSTDKSGKFFFESIPQGNYLLLASSVGYQKLYSAPLAVNPENPKITLPALTLSDQLKELSAVTISARKPFIEQKLDKTVLNVDAAVTNVGASALEVLEKAPGVSVDKDGNISLKGKQNVMVMLDGRPSYMSGEQLTNLLKSMPANTIETIELITNPSAKYDAAGNSGIINIKTKKNKQKGFNGTVSASYGQGTYWRNFNSLNLNYRTSKFNIFGNAGLGFWNGYQQLDIRRHYTDPSSKQLNAIFEQTLFLKNSEDNNNYKLGADYFLSKKTTLGFVINGTKMEEENAGKNTSYMMDPKAVVDSIISSTSNNRNNWRNTNLNLNMRHQFDSSGKELTMDLDYVKYTSNSKQKFPNTIYDPEWNVKYTETLVGQLPTDVNIYSAKMDYVHPLKKEAKLEAGFKTSYVNTDNEANYFNQVNNEMIPDYGKTNHFKYTENIVAGYLNFNKHIKKWNIQAGLRYEHTHYEGNQLGNPEKADSSFAKSYGSLFPTAFISYDVNKNNQFAVSLGRRIDRPAYQDLNPFLFFLDKFTYAAGNPYLRPQFTNNIELKHTYKGILTTTLNYSHTKDLFSEVFEQDGYATIVKHGNLGIRNNAGISISANFNVAKWWTTSLYSNYNYSKFDGMLNNEPIDISGGNFNFNANNQFKFNKGWSGELSGWYRTKGIEGQVVVDQMGGASAGIAKQVLKDKGTVKLNVRDIFYTQIAQGNIKFQSTEVWFKNSRDSRIVNISFTYRFGKQFKESGRKTGGAGDEQNRVKMGGNN